MQPDVQFQTLKEPRDIWRFVWKSMLVINAVPAVCFLILIVLQLVGINQPELGSFAIVTSLSLIPILLLGDLLFATIYYFVRRPDRTEFVRRFAWVAGAGLLTVVTCAIYISLASTDFSF